MVLFAVIDITGSTPIIIGLNDAGKKVSAEKAAGISLVIFIAFLFAGDGLLKLFNIDISSFALAGAIVIQGHKQKSFERSRSSFVLDRLQRLAELFQVGAERFADLGVLQGQLYLCLSDFELVAHVVVLAGELHSRHTAVVAGILGHGVGRRPE